MSLNAALGIANSGLASINLGLQVVSQNVANASTPAYARELANPSSLQAGGMAMGVLPGAVTRLSDPFLQAEMFGQNANLSCAQTTQASLATIDPVLGTVGAGNDLGSLVGGVQSAFSALLGNPADQTQQLAVVGSAQTLATGINTLAGSYATARQSAQNGLVSQVAQLNSALGTIGTLSDKIVTLQGLGQSTADLENQRDAAMAQVSNLVGARFLAQPNGDMLVLTSGGAQLPTHTADPLSIASATTGPTNYYPGGGLPGILMGGADVTGALTGGGIGADVALRDSTLPAAAAGLDEFAQSLAGRFNAQGLALFTGGQGNVPPGGAGPPVQAGYIGFAGAITVNPAVAANPALVRDGTQAVAGSPTGASAFTPNPTSLAGFTTMIDRVLNYALGSQVQGGVAQPAANTAGLGASGTLAAGVGTPATPLDFANALTASGAATSADATSNAATAKSVQSVLSGKLSGETGVNVDQEMATMVQLQNAYGANAKIIGAVQSMFTEALNMVQ